MKGGSEAIPLLSRGRAVTPNARNEHRLIKYTIGRITNKLGIQRNMRMFEVAGLSPTRYPTHL